MLNKVSNPLAIIVIAWCAMLAHVVSADEFKLDTTLENIPKKALIVKHDAKLFKKPYGNMAKKAPFLKLYFLMTPSQNNRVPVLETFSKTKTQPDGWLEKESFVEWNTIQMINFTPQKGRKRVKIYASKECAQTFARVGTTTEECQALGEEPRLSSQEKQQYQFLIPVFQREQDSYHGGFIRIHQDKSQPGPLGYDLVLVVDSTLSMGKYFRPTMEVLETFVEQVKQSTEAEVIIPLRVGLLFYRDRKGKNNCDLGYVTQWEQPLTPQVDLVIDALNDAQGTLCNSVNTQEAVWEGLNRAIIDTEWQKNHFQTIILIGDAPPYPTDDLENNPMQFSTAYLHKKAKEGNKRIRFLTFKIGSQDSQKFKELAFKTEPGLQGRFNFVSKSDISQFQKNLRAALLEEWSIAEKTWAALYSQTSPQALKIKPSEYPIIFGHIKQMGLSKKVQEQNLRDFVKGWVPEKIRQRLAVGEYIFIRKLDLKMSLHTIDGIILAAESGDKDGAEAFLNMVRNTLAAQLKMEFYQLFEQGEPLGEILKKANVLPFKTQVLSFTATEINTWKPVDYQNLMRTLKEKARYLREFIGNPNKEHRINETAYLYVPREYFP
ncbi:MAG: hypothetical protein DRR16_26730 [Candidatus Parabeggiatoa sp. nov. 3]|nr:MAG: hypothetical protein DRR00_29890 [Gammaproteobacteria bacterium]RKZ78935.1 MAG: hypothetical protein DRR16_26730 [Gammaproteobacteria bacterium]